MARTNRHFLPGYVWHITHRCHKKDYSVVFYAEIGGLSHQNTVFPDESDLDSVSCGGPTP